MEMNQYVGLTAQQSTRISLWQMMIIAQFGEYNYGWYIRCRRGKRLKKGSMSRVVRDISADKGESWVMLDYRDTRPSSINLCLNGALT